MGRTEARILLAGFLLSCCLVAFAACWRAWSNPAQVFPPIPSAARDGVVVREGRVLIDVNTATEPLLRTLNGIGEVLAARIVEERDENGAFADVYDLTRVKGIGEVRASELANAVVCAAP